MMIRATLILIFLATLPGQAQNWFFNSTDTTDHSIAGKNFLQLRYQIGRFVDTKTPGLQYIDSNPFQSLDFRLGHYASGQKKWHQLHHYPTYGVGIGKYFFQPYENILGNPFTTYIFFNERILRFQKSSLSYDFSFGLAYNWKPYDPVTNPEQLAIGSSISGMLGLSLQYEWKLSDRIDATLGVSMNHFSNGRIRSPNRGINLYSMGTSVRYRLGPSKSRLLKNPTATFRESKLATYEIKPFIPFYEFYVVSSAGAVTNFQDINNRSLYYWAASVSLDAARHYGYKGKYGVGLDWSFDESLKSEYQNDYPAGAVPSHLLFWPGIHLSHEYMVYRWTFITQVGINLKVVGDKENWYGRVALRYDLSKHIFLRTGIRVYKTVISDFIEWGVGYSIYSGLK